MPRTARVFIISDVKHVSISAEPNEGALVRFKVQDEVDIDLWLSAETLASKPC